MCKRKGYKTSKSTEKTTITETVLARQRFTRRNTDVKVHKNPKDKAKELEGKRSEPLANSPDSAQLADTHQEWWTYQCLAEEFASPCGLMYLLVSKEICSLSCVYSVYRMSFRMAETVRGRWLGKEALQLPHDWNLSLRVRQGLQISQKQMSVLHWGRILVALLSQNSFM